MFKLEIIAVLIAAIVLMMIVPNIGVEYTKQKQMSFVVLPETFFCTYVLIQYRHRL